MPVGTLTSLACSVKPASCQPSDAQALAQAYLAKVDAAHVSDVTGAMLAPLADACYLHSGRTRAYEMNLLDNDEATRTSTNRRRGSSRRDLQVLAERFLINPDGSARREIDVKYDLVYADGMVVPQNETLIQGSSAGSRMADGGWRMAACVLHRRCRRICECSVIGELSGRVSCR